jgi:DNA-binding CsgD family transcriptional regulator
MDWGPQETLADKRAGLGITVLSASLKVLYLNRRATELFDQINRAESSLQRGNPTQGILPASVTTLCADILILSQERTLAKDWEQFEVTRIVVGSMSPMLLRGFGLPDPRGPAHSRITIIVEEVGRRRHTGLDQSRERFQLTEREQAVIEHLTKGWTNKEIAAAMGITALTVRDHLKHIMQKTGSTTRTAIIMKILCA